MSKIVCNVCGDAVQCYDPEDLGLGCKKAPCPGHYCLERDLEDPRFIPPVTDTLTTLLAWAEANEGTWPIAVRGLFAENDELRKALAAVLDWIDADTIRDTPIVEARKLLEDK